MSALRYPGIQSARKGRRAGFGVDVFAAVRSNRPGLALTRRCTPGEVNQMNAVAESPTRALPERVPRRGQGCPGPLDRLQLLGAAARLGGQALRAGPHPRQGRDGAGRRARQSHPRAVPMSRPNAATGRFKDPTLTGNGRQPPGGHRLMRGYLATCQASGEFDELEGI